MSTNGATIAIDPAKGQNGAKVPHYSPSEKDRKTIKAVADAGRKLRRHKIPLEKQWFVNLAALQNQYWLSWNTVTRNWDIPLKGPGEGIKLSINLALPFWQRSVAQITASPPIMHVAPATTDEEDGEIARLTQQVVDGEFERIGITSLQKKLAGWQYAVGTVFAEVRWDPWIGPPMFEDVPLMSLDPLTGEVVPQIDPETGEPMTERQPMTDEDGRQLHLGDSVVEVFSAFEAGCDPFASGVDDAGWFFREAIKPISWIRRHFKNGKYVEAEKDLWGDSTYEKLVKQLAGSQGTTAGEGEDDAGPIQDASRVQFYREAPCDDYPQGRDVITSNGVLLWDEANPYTKQVENGINLPIVEIVEIAVNGRAIGMSTLEHAIPLIRALNRRRSQEEENTAVFGRPKVLIPKGSGVTENAFNSRAGEKIFYTPIQGAKPEPWVPQSTAMATDMAIRHLLADLQEVMSTHDATVGRMPSANAPAEAVRLLRVGDDTVRNQAEGHTRDAFIKLAKMLICNAMQFWTEERMVRVTGEDNAITANKISGMRLSGSGEGNYCDVRMIPQSTMQKDPKVQMERVDWLLQRGILNPALHMREILKMADLGTLDPILKQQRLDESWANKENEFMEQGLPLMPRDFEDQNVHIRQHDLYRKSQRYRDLPVELQAIFDQHVEAHKQMQVVKASQEMANQAAVAMAGQPPPGAGGPSPGAPPEVPDSGSDPGSPAS